MQSGRRVYLWTRFGRVPDPPVLCWYAGLYVLFESYSGFGRVVIGLAVLLPR